MFEFVTNKFGQIRPPSGMAFWSFSAEMIKEITIEGHDDPTVRWDGREWICKQDERTLNEVVGYQIASYIGLPLQTWVAFESPTHRSIGAGMLVEWWSSAYLQSSLVDLGANHEALVARGLAFWVFGRDEWPMWLLSENTRDVRLIDLDGTGPLMTVPPHEALLINYLDATKCVFCNARDKAEQLGITDAFHSEMHHLLSIDLSKVIDLSGYPHAVGLAKIMIARLQKRQREIGKLLRSH